MSSDNTEQEAYMAKIQATIEDSMRSFIGEPNNDNTRRCIAAALEKELAFIPDSEASVKDCADMWTRMDFMMRCKWLLANRLLPWVGRDVRAYFTAWRAGHPDDEDVDYSAYPHSWIPEWAVDDPKNIMITTVVLNIPLPMRSVQMNFTVGDE